MTQEILSQNLIEINPQADSYLAYATPEHTADEVEVIEEEPPLHIPVMQKEAVDYLKLKPGQVVVDATIGTGGHSEKILEHILPGGRLIGIDRDEDSLSITKKRLERFSANCAFVHGNFTELEHILASLSIKKVDGILFDLGISSFQLDDPKRGFSFQGEGPLDMRMDRASYISAYDLLNNLHEDEISEMLLVFGQERWHRRIARAIVQERDKHPLNTTAQLVDIVLRATPYRYRYGYQRIHPATRTFQAIRIAVNRELEALELVLDQAIASLNKRGRICVISFHSLEDRIVKIKFKQALAAQLVKILTPKPLVPQEAEVAQNPASRSSKFRAAERV